MQQESLAQRQLYVVLIFEHKMPSLNVSQVVLCLSVHTTCQASRLITALLISAYKIKRSKVNHCTLRICAHKMPSNKVIQSLYLAYLCTQDAKQQGHSITVPCLSVHTRCQAARSFNHYLAICAHKMPSIKINQSLYLAYLFTQYAKHQDQSMCLAYLHAYKMQSIKVIQSLYLAYLCIQDAEQQGQSTYFAYLCTYNAKPQGQFLPFITSL